MRFGHPADTLCRLDMSLGRQSVGIVKRRDLDIDKAGQEIRVAKPQARAAVRTEAAHGFAR